MRRHKAFRVIKEYLIKPLGLCQPVKGKELFLYLAASAIAVSVTLVKTGDDGAQKLVYFISKMLTDIESRYIDFEQIALALRVATIQLPSYLIKAILHRPEPTSRLLKWAIKLSEFDIVYRPRTTIKGQILSDFVAELSNVHGDDPSSKVWILKTDGSSKKIGAVLVWCCNP